MHPRDMPLYAARALVARAIDKAEDIGVRGAVAVVGASGVLVSASRMDRGGTSGMARARSKAWIAATQQMPSVVHLGRMRTLPAPMERGFVAVLAGGGVPRRGRDADRRPGVIAGIAASGATVGPFVDYPGAERRKLIADGKPANGEDLLVHYALGIPYAGQHGDDEQRWLDAYGALPDEPGLGHGRPAAAAAQLELAWALDLADRVLAAARRARRPDRGRDRRPPRRPDPAGLHGRRADRRPLRGRGRRRGRRDVPAAERRAPGRRSAAAPLPRRARARRAALADGGGSSPGSASAARRRSSATSSPPRCSL